ncbi:hypothetical protein QAD02_017451 [Eretmocerus hayati]|uniref:Uncharacterized protein n=1 Tax=Eretmocerus hayati TaxID=131215 RepID=A0ACC2PEC4_9HYME|nr:hypothetical protein QAD02_017451 [Eretmocerus hayati]
MEASGSQENVNTPDHSVLDTLIDLLPFEMNVPGYRFLGPGTKLAERLERGEVGVCPLDDYAREHDIAYANKNADRRKADRVLAERAFSRMLASHVDPDERTLALMTACCMPGVYEDIELLVAEINELDSISKHLKFKVARGGYVTVERICTDDTCSALKHTLQLSKRLRNILGFDPYVHDIHVNLKEPTVGKFPGPPTRPLVSWVAGAGERVHAPDEVGGGRRVSESASPHT